MKKALIVVLLFLYGSSATGATVHLHYCMSKFIGLSLWHGNDTSCGNCGMKEKKGGCCKDEHKYVKVKADHQKSTVNPFVKFIATPVLNNLPAFVAIGFKAIPLVTAHKAHAPPLLVSGWRLCILNRVFRI